VTIAGMKWRGRTFDVKLGATSTTVTLRGGSGMTVSVRGSDHQLAAGGSLSVSTRRPDLAPTTNLARCRPATASSEETGMYPEAAVDGSQATYWALDPDASSGSLRVDLGKRQKIKVIAVDWTNTRPGSYSIETSLDGSTWSAAPAADADGTLHNTVNARYVRVTLTRASDERVGIRELRVTG
jgi:hypothetical protein